MIYVHAGLFWWSRGSRPLGWMPSKNLSQPHRRSTSSTNFSNCHRMLMILTCSSLGPLSLFASAHRMDPWPWASFQNMDPYLLLASLWRWRDSWIAAASPTVDPCLLACFWRTDDRLVAAGSPRVDPCRLVSLWITDDSSIAAASPILGPCLLTSFWGIDDPLVAADSLSADPCLLASLWRMDDPLIEAASPSVDPLGTRSELPILGRIIGSERWN